MANQGSSERTPIVPPVTPLGRGDTVLDLLQMVSRQLVAMTASALVHLDAGGRHVSLPEYRVLVLLASGPKRPSELADDLEVTRPAIAQILGRLEETRMVSRRPRADDRRSALISLTARGDSVVQAVLAERERRLRPALSALGRNDRRALAGALAKLNAAL